MAERKGRKTSRARARARTDEGRSFLAPPATNLKGKGAAPQRETVCDDFQPAVVEAIDGQVEVSQAGVGSHPCPSSRPHPQLRRTLDVEHAARWSPRGSKRRWHRHVFCVTGSGRRRRRSKTVRNKWEGAASPATVGRAVGTLLAKGPCWDSNRAGAAGAEAGGQALENVVLNGSGRLPLPATGGVARDEQTVSLVRESGGLGTYEDLRPGRRAPVWARHGERGSCG